MYKIEKVVNKGAAKISKDLNGENDNFEEFDFIQLDKM